MINLNSCIIKKVLSLLLGALFDFWIHIPMIGWCHSLHVYFTICLIIFQSYVLLYTEWYKLLILHLDCNNHIVLLFPTVSQTSCYKIWIWRNNITDILLLVTCFMVANHCLLLDCVLTHILLILFTSVRVMKDETKMNFYLLKFHPIPRILSLAAINIKFTETQNINSNTTITCTLNC